MSMELANPISCFSSQHARAPESLINAELPVQASYLARSRSWRGSVSTSVCGRDLGTKEHQQRVIQLKKAGDIAYRSQKKSRKKASPIFPDEDDRLNGKAPGSGLGGFGLSQSHSSATPKTNTTRESRLVYLKILTNIWGVGSSRRAQRPAIPPSERASSQDLGAGEDKPPAASDFDLVTPAGSPR